MAPAAAAAAAAALWLASGSWHLPQAAHTPASPYTTGSNAYRALYWMQVVRAQECESNTGPAGPPAGDAQEGAAAEQVCGLGTCHTAKKFNDLVFMVL